MNILGLLVQIYAFYYFHPLFFRPVCVFFNLFLSFTHIFHDHSGFRQFSMCLKKNRRQVPAVFL